jgi:hypothetical protein
MPWVTGAGRSRIVLGIKLKAEWLGLMAVLLLGAWWVTSANAMGPFYYHRTIGSTVKGVKIAESAPETVEGKGGEQKLKGKIGGQELEIESANVQVKGEIYNTGVQAQAKLKLVYSTPKLVNPNDPNCEVKVGPENTVHIEVWLVWKWNGTQAQLKNRQSQHKLGQVVDGIAFARQHHFTAAEEESKEIELPTTEEFTEIVFAKSIINCGFFSGQSGKVTGADPITVRKPGNLEEFSKAATFISEGSSVKLGQHICFKPLSPECTGFKFVGLEFGGAESEYKGEFEIIDPNQEVALYEE